MRLVIVSFAIMALVFYELSGGSDFQPPERPAVAESTAKPRTEPAPRPASEPVRVAPATLVTQTPPPKPAVAQPAARETVARAPSPELQQVRASLSQGLTLVSDDAPANALSLASLELGASGLRAASATESVDVERTDLIAAQEADLREIIGTRVNMRDGPGTIYPIITRLNIGQSVEVLSESGTGWLRLRTIPGRQIGWISASLVSKRSR